MIEATLRTFTMRSNVLFNEVKPSAEGLEETIAFQSFINFRDDLIRAVGFGKVFTDVADCLITVNSVDINAARSGVLNPKFDKVSMWDVITKNDHVNMGMPVVGVSSDFKDKGAAFNVMFPV